MSPQRLNLNSRTPQRGVPTRTVRKRLPHEVPLWLHPSREDYFITVCCRERGRNQLANANVGQALLDTIKHRSERQLWYAHLAVIMPDHVHLIITFGTIDMRTQVVVSKCKEWTAKSLGICWQRAFFEHRLRKEESFARKLITFWRTRAGLVERWEDWPYMFIADPW